MRCSSFEPLLDDFVDGTLSPVVRARVFRHVEDCEHCQGLLEELRVVDALLLVPRQLEPAPNFTFAMMAEARDLPHPHHRRTPALWVVLTYLAFAWVAIGTWFVLDRGAVRAMLSFFETLGVQYGQGVTALAHSATRLFGGATPDVGMAAGAILAIDIFLALAFAAAWVVIRPRLLARAARTSEGSS